ncbi:MAG TPA: O-antigen ligase family protein [Polyangiaceae bacterium]|nr:O-antigen ligase family protein [Polyangiaceae bacterium]
MAKARIGAEVSGAVAGIAALILVGTLIDDQIVGILVALLVFPLIVFAMSRVPIRVSMMALLFLVLVLPNPSEGLPTAWRPPFCGLGATLMNRFNSLLREVKLFDLFWFSGLDVLFVTLGVIIRMRRSSGSTIDGPRVPTPKPLIQLAWLSLGTALFTWLSGLARGGDFRYSLWQLNAVIYLPIIFLLFQAGLRGAEDLGALARVVVTAALYKAGLAYYVVHFITGYKDADTGSTTPPFGTSHADSVLFSVAVVLLLICVIERVHKKAKLHALLILPILLGVKANNRRLAWAEIGLTIAVILIASRESAMKRKIRRYLLALAPILTAYVVAGWNTRNGRLFKPVQMIRSMAEPKTDSSSLWRELENYNIIVTFRDHFLLGTGFGHPYEQAIVLPAVEYSLERYAPHNSLLGVWCYTGLVGFAGLTLLWAGGIYFAMRVYYNSPDPTSRSGALMVLAVVLIYLMQSWGDIGLSSWSAVFLMGAAMAVAGKLAVTSGEWSSARKAPAGGFAAPPRGGFARPGPPR